MNNLVSTYLLSIIVLTGCNHDDSIEPSPEPIIKAEIPFTGTWERQFEAGPGNLYTVNYYIYQDSIRYKLGGPIGNADYLMQRDTFLIENNRFIGHTNADKYYLMFTKNVSNNAITIYKQEIGDLIEGLSIDMPSDTTTQNHGWNTFHN
ncbi:MAG: hypothetical protein ACR2MS_00200 [Weeksellaceae bacterium]